jgi:hypothetical protein
MDYSKVEEEIIKLTDTDNYRNMEITQKKELKRITLLMELEKVKQLSMIQDALSSIDSYIRGD